MKLLTTLLASFFAVALGNPLGDMTAPEVARNCQTLPFLICTGVIDQEIACGDTAPWTCPGNGLHPVTSNATCAADCVCEIPCP
ncbi:hypothetical protein B0H16DRAFT_1525795 [Mycena metata]|uniref:Uncharacterized protein n=1 Tax=Mycena metata TaxID=1033252 RepID=A0AAD7NL02_9AGAR|nr:hypothetical protein B0H16DRAFT_1525795 [Mycena metata]